MPYVYADKVIPICYLSAELTREIKFFFQPIFQ